MFKQTIQFMLGVSLGRDDYISSLEDVRSFHLASMSFIITLTLLILTSFLNKLSQSYFLSKYAPEIVQDLTLNPKVIISLLLIFIIFWVIFTTLIVLSALMIGAKPLRIIPIFTALGLTAPHLILMMKLRVPSTLMALIIYNPF